MQFSENIKMSDIIHENYHLLPVLKRFGINLGFGDKLIGEVCSDKNINTAFFLDIINSYNDITYFPQKHLAGFTVKLIVEYLKKSHEYYLNEKVPLIEGSINKLVTTSKTDNKNILLIENFFAEYKKELIIHIKREDEIIYPYVLEIERIYINDECNTDTLGLINKNSILRFADEHDNMEEKLYDLKNILIKYLPMQNDQSLLHIIIKDLFELEKDLADHSRIEDKVLVPKIYAMENVLKKKSIH